MADGHKTPVSFLPTRLCEKTMNPSCLSAREAEEGQELAQEVVCVLQGEYLLGIQPGTSGFQTLFQWMTTGLVFMPKKNTTLQYAQTMQSSSSTIDLARALVD